MSVSALIGGRVKMFKFIFYFPRCLFGDTISQVWGSPGLQKVFIWLCFVVCFTNFRASATYMKCGWIQGSVLAGAELVGVCSVTWSYPKVDLKRGKWFQVLLMVRHGAKWWSRYIGSSQQGSHTSDLRLQKNYITRPDAGKHLALSFTRKKKQHQQWQHRGGLYLVDVAQVSFSLSQVWGADRRQARWRWGWETLAAMKGYHGNVAEI